MMNVFTPPYSNIMSYWDNCNPPIFTNGQFVRVNSTLNNYGPLINCTAASDYTQNAITVSSGYFVKSAINTFNTNGSVIISATTVATFGGYSLTLSPGFQAVPSGQGSTNIKITNCY